MNLNRRLKKLEQSICDDIVKKYWRIHQNEFTDRWFRVDPIEQVMDEMEPDSEKIEERYRRLTEKEKLKYDINYRVEQRFKKNRSEY